MAYFLPPISESVDTSIFLLLFFAYELIKEIIKT